MTSSPEMARSVIFRAAARSISRWKRASASAWFARPSSTSRPRARRSARRRAQSAGRWSGPIRAKGAYFFTLRTDGLTNLAGTAKAASTATLPALGPRALPASKRRHFFTVFDLLTYGYNPVLPEYADPGTTWAGRPGTRDFDVYGVTGHAKVLAPQQVTVPAGTFRAVGVQTTLAQAGFPWGSGTRTSWFAPGKGLVKLVFRHADGSVSEVVRLK